MLTAKEIRDKSVPELVEQLMVVRKELFDFFNEERLTKKVDKPHLKGQKRREIARILTELRAKQLEEKQ